MRCLASRSPGKPGRRCPPLHRSRRRRKRSCAGGNLSDAAHARGGGSRLCMESPNFEAQAKRAIQQATRRNIVALLSSR
jgi:hypothetical protein